MLNRHSVENRMLAIGQHSSTENYSDHLFTPSKNRSPRVAWPSVPFQLKEAYTIFLIYLANHVSTKTECIGAFLTSIKSSVADVVTNLKADFGGLETPGTRTFADDFQNCDVGALIIF